MAAKSIVVRINLDIITSGFAWLIRLNAARVRRSTLLEAEAARLARGAANALDCSPHPIPLSG
jgi:hypothetical protein